MSELPQGWIGAALEECSIFNPKHSVELPASIDVSFVPMPAVSDVSGEIEGAQVRRLDEVWKGYTHFQTGDVIFAKITPCMENGKIAVARNLINGLACGSTEFHVLRPYNGVSAEFLWRFLRQKSFRADAEHSMTGAVGQRRVPAGFLKKTIVPLPPVPEQQRIVAKIDSLSSKSERVRDRLDHIPRLVEKYKQAVLAAAFRGELTHEWRSQAGRPHTWEDTTLGQLLVDIRYGTAKKCGYDAGAVGVLRIPNVQLGKISVDDLKSADFTVDELTKLRLEEGDILIIRSNGSLDLVGRSAIVDNAAAGLLFAGYLIRLRLNPDLAHPEFVQLYLRTTDTRTLVERLAKSTSGVNNINSTQIQQLPISRPDIDEQHEIVRLIDITFAWIDRLASETTGARKLVDHLDQAILSKAFRGELVPQDPNDEPAGVLLERIRAERAAIAR